MVLQGELKEISNGFWKSRSRMTKYDYIILGEYRIKDVSFDYFLEPS